MELKREDFAAWLASKGTGVVNNPYHEADGLISTTCPIALWLAAKAGKPYQVGIMSYCPFGDEAGSKELPSWAQSFVFRFDGSEYSKSPAWPALGALSVLNTIP